MSSTENIIKNTSPKLGKSNFAEYKKLVIGGVLVAVAFCIGFFGAYPLYANFEKTNGQIEVENKKLTDLDLRLSQLDKIKKIAETVNSTTVTSLQSVPEEDEIPVVMAMVQEITKNSGVKIASFSYSGMNTVGPSATTPATPSTTAVAPANSASVKPTAAKPDYNAFSLTLTAKGTFSDVKRFITNLENSRRILNVKTFSYSVTREETEIVGTTLSLQVNIESYFKKFDQITTNVNLDQYATLITKLNDLKYTEIDLTNPNVGKIDPFKSNSPTPTTSPNGSNTTNTTNGEGFFNGTNDSDTNINVVEIEGTGQTVQEEAPVEADPGDTTKLLQDLLQKEGL